LTWRAPTPLERTAAPPKRVSCLAQSTPALARQEQSQRKLLQRARRWDRWYGAEIQQNGERSRHNLGTFAARVDCCRKAVNQKILKNHLNEKPHVQAVVSLSMCASAAGSTANLLWDCSHKILADR